jgi:hypothetical protein
MEALLAVLGEGDAKLMAKARETHAQWHKHVEASGKRGETVPARQTRWQDHEVRSAWKLLNTFAVADLARPLQTDDSHAMADEQIIDGSAPIAVMVHVLTRYEQAFVRTSGEIAGVLSRADLEQPIGRMWLFGIVTLVEVDFGRRIRARWPEESWAALLSPGRLDKARELQEERARRVQQADLLDCLQLADKGAILIQDPDVLSDWGFRSKQSAKTALQDLQSLRNHLAHSQAIVEHHWHQIAGLSRRLDDWMLEQGEAIDLPR